jgi:hypothetical protein
VWGGILAAWAAVTGIAPHVLHYVGPLAGAAVLAGAGGKAILFALGPAPVAADAPKLCVEEFAKRSACGLLRRRHVAVLIRSAIPRQGILKESR